MNLNPRDITTYHDHYTITWSPGCLCVVRSSVRGLVGYYRDRKWDEDGALPDDVRAAAMAARPTSALYADKYSRDAVFADGELVELHPSCEGMRYAMVRGMQDGLVRVAGVAGEKLLPPELLRLANYY